MEIFDRAVPSEVAFRTGDYPRGRDPDYDPVNLREILGLIGYSTAGHSSIRADWYQECAITCAVS
jgi:hypothetical protein